MKILVTGSSGHLGEALVRTLTERGFDVLGLDIRKSAFTSVVASVDDIEAVTECMQGVEFVYHTATLHKPHVATHSMQEFIDTNISGTLVLLQAAEASGVTAFVFTSTTSMFGDALRPPAGTPATWVTEDVRPIPKNIYGVTKTAAEDLCRLFHRQHALNCIILRTSRFFPEEDDDKLKRDKYDDENAKANEYLFRRVELEDVVSAHIAAAQRAPELGFGRYIISATTPFLPEDLPELNTNAPLVVRKRMPAYEEVYERLGWSMFDKIDRVYVNTAARKDLGWRPKYDFAYILKHLKAGAYPTSSISEQVGSKGYHDKVFKDGPYPV
ncbi:NAD-dependent epimerase/dehydratase family protein [Pseudomonadota bacterium]